MRYLTAEVDTTIFMTVAASKKTKFKLVKIISTETINQLNRIWRKSNDSKQNFECVGLKVVVSCQKP